MKNILVISTSPRVRSNSDALAEEFFRGEGGKICIIKNDDMGDIEGHPALQKAYEMGKSIK